jgi:hypothetical protein
MQQDTKNTEQEIFNKSFNPTFGLNENLIYGFDGVSAVALKLNADGTPSNTKPHVDLTWDAGFLQQKVETYSDRTVTTDYTWVGGNLTEKTITIT